MARRRLYRRPGALVHALLVDQIADIFELVGIGFDDVLGVATRIAVVAVVPSTN
jgi:hypothetical protein